MLGKKGVEWTFMLYFLLALAGFLVALGIIYAVFPGVVEKVIAGIKGI